MSAAHTHKTTTARGFRIKNKPEAFVSIAYTKKSNGESIFCCIFLKNFHSQHNYRPRSVLLFAEVVRKEKSKDTIVFRISGEIASVGGSFTLEEVFPYFFYYLSDMLPDSF